MIQQASGAAQGLPDGAGLRRAPAGPPGGRAPEAQGLAGGLREYSSTGYGLRLSTEIYGSKRGFLGIPTGSLFCFYRISGNLREFTGEYNLGILYSSSLLRPRTRSTKWSWCTGGGSSAPLWSACWGPCSRSELGLEGTKGSRGMGVVQVAAGLIAFCSRFFTCPSPRVDRCSNPLPWDPLSPP